MQRSGLAKIGVGVLAVVSLLGNILVSGAVIALVTQLQFWSYPVMFILGLGLIAFVFVILIPPARKDAVSITSGWTGRARDRIRGAVLPPDGLERQKERLSRGLWKWLHGKGPAILIIVVCIILGPFFAAITARILGLPESSAWRFTIMGTVLSVGIWVSVYLGVIEWAKVLFLSLIVGT